MKAFYSFFPTCEVIIAFQSFFFRWCSLRHASLAVGPWCSFSTRTPAISASITSCCSCDQWPSASATAENSISTERNTYFRGGACRCVRVACRSLYKTGALEVGTDVSILVNGHRSSSNCNSRDALSYKRQKNHNCSNDNEDSSNNFAKEFHRGNRAIGGTALTRNSSCSSLLGTRSWTTSSKRDVMMSPRLDSSAVAATPATAATVTAAGTEILHGGRACTFVDIGVNLTDEMYEGIYHGRRRHLSDLRAVVERARVAGCRRLLLTGSSLQDSLKAISLCRSLDPKGNFLFATVGVHPTRCEEFLLPLRKQVEEHQRQGPDEVELLQVDLVGQEPDPQRQRSCKGQQQQQKGGAQQEEHSLNAQHQLTEKICGAENTPLPLHSTAEKEFEVLLTDAEEDLLQHHIAQQAFQVSAASVAYLRQLCAAIATNRDRVAAVGELGLDSDRTNFCDLETQKRFFELQLVLSKLFSLPLFLHMRNSDESFCEILARNRPLWESQGGVVHSFTGCTRALRNILSMSSALEIGINGCSLKTAENLDVVREIPLDRLHFETDSPWCDIRPTHAGYAILKEHYPQLLTAVKCKPDKWLAGHQVRGRNEPCNVVQVVAIAHQLVAPHLDFRYFCERTAENSMRLFSVMAGPKSD